MANETMTLIETKTAGAGGAANFDFTGIANTYTDLCILVSGRSSANSVELRIQFNNDTGTNYYTRAIYGSGTSAASTSTNFAFLNPYGSNFSGSTSNIFGNASIYIPNYAGSTQKSISIDGATENNATEAYSATSAGLWTGTAAITSIKLLAQTGTWIEGSTASLYGIKQGGTGTITPIAPKATGGTIAYSGGYWYHTFTSSGTFTPTVSLSADILTVAGGAGGGRWGSGGGGGGGGGGAGGLVYSASQSLTTTGYTVTVGAGGAAEASGSNSVFTGQTTAVGGGRGASNTDYSALTGGSGGGGSNGGYYNEYRNGAAGTSGQGYAGGNATTNSNYAGGGGGGGAGAVGADGGGVGGNGGNGGNGVNTYSSWLTATGKGVAGYVAGGGGGGSWYTGGSGGSGGGGAGGGYPGSGYVPYAATAGTANTGSGGGGNANYNGNIGAAAAGGSGIVIVRYAA